MKKVGIVLSIVFLFFALSYGEEKEENVPVCDPSFCFVSNDTGVIKLTGAISSTEYGALIDAVHVFERKKVKRIKIYLTSPGGDVFAGLAIAGFLSNLSVPVQIRAYGLVASAAVLVLVAGDERLIDRNALVMVHELAVLKFYSYENVTEKEKELEVLKTIQDKIVSFVAERTKTSPEELRKLCKEETWFDAQKALVYGFADRLITEE